MQSLETKPLLLDVHSICREIMSGFILSMSEIW
jgi:hypothetical protein